jgi:hypothetical protein
MKNEFLSACLAVAALMSCSKDETAALPAIDAKPVSSSFSTANGYAINATGSNADKAVGIRFKVARNGRITKLGCSMPAASAYEITLWEVSGANPLVLSRQTVQQTTNATYVERGITPIQLVPTKEYVVSIFAGGNQIFSATKGGTSNVFPVSSGNITFLSAQSIIASTSIGVTNATYPNQAGQTGALGLTDFEFVAD